MKWRYFLLVCLGIILVISRNLIWVDEALSFATKLMPVSGDIISEIVVPDWQRISFSQLPPIASSGSVELTDGVVKNWSEGQTPAQYLGLGDVSELRPDLASLDYLSSYLDEALNFSEISLNQFPLVGEQTIGHLVSIVPDLATSPVTSVVPIVSIIDGYCSPSLLSGTVADALSSCSVLASLKLNVIDLSIFAISSIPNLHLVPLGDFVNWQEALIEEIPGLSELPLGFFPNPLTATGSAVARIDAIWGSAEQKRHQTVSGSDKVGFEYPCIGQNCPYIELDDLEAQGRVLRDSFEGRSWISGKYQQVPGGNGCLSFVNGGKEPTGRHPWGSAFKVVVEEPDETTDSVETALYFRFQNFCGATPYFIGPVPFFSYHVNSPIFLGASVKELKKLCCFSDSEAINNTHLVGRINSFPIPKEENSTTDSSGLKKVNLAKLARILSRDNSYQQVSAFVSSDKGKGRILGKYNWPSYAPEITAVIEHNSPAKSWLKSLSQGQKISASDLFTYLPPVTQDLIVTSVLTSKLKQASTEIDPQTSNSFSHQRLIERVAQKYGFGNGAKIDGNFANTSGMTIINYGENIAQQYGYGRD